jgi:hypothetical protein
MDIPIIKIEISGMRQSICNALALHNVEFNDMVFEAVEKSFTPETIKAKIEMQVAKALDNAIDSLSEHHMVKTIVKDIVVQSLVKKRQAIENENGRIFKKEKEEK